MPRAFFLIFIFSTYNEPDNNYAEECLVIFSLRIHFLFPQIRKYVPINVSENIFRIHPISCISCMFDSATSKLSAKLSKYTYVLGSHIRGNVI